MSRRLTFARLGMLAVMIVALLVAGATLALAGPSEPMMGVAELQTRLDAAGGSLDGYLKTVDKGSTIIEIPVKVLAVTTGYGDGPVDMSSLIYFRAVGPEIDSIGGIAAGMSGSPIYVTVGGQDRLIGALSYGDMFTLNGAGLATPIEAMSAIQSTYASSMLPRRLSLPVIVDGELKDSVMIVSGANRMASEPARTIVAKPLSAAYIGGISPQSRMYKAYAKHLTGLGMDVIPLQGGLSAMESSYNAAFRPGSAIAVLAARGDMWAGGIGTVTYTDGHDVVAFGHPAFWEGDTSLYMSNAWIDGVWPDSLEAYKLGRPAALRGTLTQDRLEGILGVDGTFPAETPITAHALNEATGKTATSRTLVPRHVINASGYNFYGLAATSAYVAGSRVFNASTIPGSADATTTVVVSDGARTYTIKRADRFSDPNDISMATVNDVNQMVSDFEDANGNGIAHADILSVDLDATYHKARNEAEIVSVDVAGGLKTGQNTVKVSLLLYGDPATHTVDVPFTTPADVPLTGDLKAESINDPNGFGSSSDTLGMMLQSDSPSGPTTDRRSVSDVVKELTDAADNSTFRVSFAPSAATSTSAGTYDTIDTTATTPWVVRSSATKTAPAITAYLDAESYAYGREASVYGMLTGVSSSGEIAVSGKGVPTSIVPISGGSFSYVSPPLKHTTTLHFSFAGSDDALAAEADVVVGVAAKTKLQASKKSVAKGTSVTLTAEVRPHNAGHEVAFQRSSGSSWKTLKTVTLPATGKAKWAYKPGRTGLVRLRARYLGSGVALASNSKSLTIDVH